MARFILAVLCGLALACGGGDDEDTRREQPLDTDYSGNFVGWWTGELAMTAGGETTISPDVYLPIEAIGFNRLRLEEMCADGSHVTATVTSASQFRTDVRTCPPTAFTGCSAVTVKYNAGTGTLVGGTLTLGIPGEMSGCGQRFAFTMRHVATRDPLAAAAALRAAGPSVAELVSATAF